MNLSEIKAPKKEHKSSRKELEQQIRPDAAQVKLLAAFLAVENLGFTTRKMVIKDDVVTIGLFGRPETISLSNLNRYEQEANSLIHVAINGASDGDGHYSYRYVKEEYDMWVKDVKRMTWDMIKKNWDDYTVLVKTMTDCWDKWNSDASS